MKVKIKRAHEIADAYGMGPDRETQVVGGRVKVKIKRKLKPLSVIDDQPHLTEGITVGRPGGSKLQLPEGTLVRYITYYGPRGPKAADYSTDNGVTWVRGWHWNDLPLSEGAEVCYV